MTTATVSFPTSSHRGVRTRLRIRDIGRVLSGVVLVVAAVATLAGAGYVVIDRIGFSPVLSPSMKPTFDPGDLVVTRPVSASQLHVGDVAVLPVPHEPGQRYVHRIIKLSWSHGQPVVRTKGDANSAPEPFALRITSSKVPVVVTTVPRLGRFALLIRGGWLRVLLLCGIAAFALVGVKRLLLDR
jgi:signal peptidase I